MTTALVGLLAGLLGYTIGAITNQSSNMAALTLSRSLLLNARKESARLANRIHKQRVKIRQMRELLPPKQRPASMAKVQ